MANTEKKKDTLSQQNDKQRHAVLKTFKKRLWSSAGHFDHASDKVTDHPPGKLADKALPTEDKKHSKVILVMDSSASDKDHLSLSKSQENPGPDKFIVKAKKRKSRSQRNKLHSTSRSRSEADVHSTKERSEFKKHLKTVQKSQKVAILQPSAESITQNRLTRNLGLYNKGKTSGDIAREADTREQMRKILYGCNSKPQRGPMDDQSSSAHSVSTGIVKEAVNADKRPTDLSHSAQPVITPKSESLSLQSIASPSPPGVQMDIDTVLVSPASKASDSLPSSPVWEEVVHVTVAGLNPMILHPGRSILQERIEELNRLVKLNPPIPVTENSHKTPLKKTPVSDQGSTFPHVHGSKSSETVCRGQGDADSQSLQTELDVDSAREQCFSAHSICYPTADVMKVNAGHDDACLHQINPLHHHGSTDIGNFENDTSLIDKSQTKKHDLFKFNSDFGRRPMSEIEIKALTDGNALFALNEQVASSQDSAARETSQNTVSDILDQTTLLSSYKPGDINQRISGHGTSSDMYSSRSVLGYNDLGKERDSLPVEIQRVHLFQDIHPTHAGLRQNEGGHLMTLNSSTQRAVAQPVCSSAYRPGQHAEAYSMGQHDDQFQNLYHQHQTQPVGSMDILEYIDRASHNAPSDNHDHHAVMVKPVYPRQPKPKHRFLTSASPDSDGSPLWYASLPPMPPVLPKPPVLSPSPPQKMYPRRLY